MCSLDRPFFKPCCMCNMRTANTARTAQILLKAHYAVNVRDTHTVLDGGVASMGVWASRKIPAKLVYSCECSFDGSRK